MTVKFRHLYSPVWRAGVGWVGVGVEWGGMGQERSLGLHTGW